MLCVGSRGKFSSYIILVWERLKILSWVYWRVSTKSQSAMRKCVPWCCALGWSRPCSFPLRLGDMMDIVSYMDKDRKYFFFLLTHFNYGQRPLNSIPLLWVLSIYCLKYSELFGEFEELLVKALKELRNLVVALRSVGIFYCVWCKEVTGLFFEF